MDRLLTRGTWDPALTVSGSLTLEGVLPYALAACTGLVLEAAAPACVNVFYLSEMAIPSCQSPVLLQ